MTQPELDLMVLLEKYSANVSADAPRLVPLTRHYRIHLRTMSTNEPHPLAGLSSPLLGVGWLRCRQLDKSQPMGIYGRMLYLRFVPNPRRAYQESVIILFDWIAGVKVEQIRLEPYAGCSIEFPPEEYFPIAKAYKRTEEALSNNYSTQTGSILIYYLPVHVEGEKNRRAKHVVILMLPSYRLCEDQNDLTLYLCGGPAPVPETSYWSTRVKHVLKTYDLGSWDHLCLYYETPNRGDAGTPDAGTQSRRSYEKDLDASGLLYIDSQALLALFIQLMDVEQVTDPIPVPWEVWKDYVVCLPSMDVPNTSAYMWGRRSAFIYNSDEPSFNGVPNCLVIFEFTHKETCAPQPSEGAGGNRADASVLAPSEFCNLAGTTSPIHPQQASIKCIGPGMECRKINFKLEHEKYPNLRESGLTAIDDENLVTRIKLWALEYTFNVGFTC